MGRHAQKNNWHHCNTELWINVYYDDFLKHPLTNNYANTFAMMIGYEALYYWQNYEMFYTDKEFDNNELIYSYLHKNTIAEIEDYLYFTSAPEFGPARVIDDFLGK